MSEAFKPENLHALRSKKEIFVALSPTRFVLQRPSMRGRHGFARVASSEFFAQSGILAFEPQELSLRQIDGLNEPREQIHELQDVSHLGSQLQVQPVAIVLLFSQTISRAHERVWPSSMSRLMSSSSMRKRPMIRASFSVSCSALR